MSRPRSADLTPRAVGDYDVGPKKLSEELPWNSDAEKEPLADPLGFTESDRRGSIAPGLPANRQLLLDKQPAWFPHRHEK